MARIVVAMSGGVDSSVTAALLHAQGHDVIGVTLDVWPAETPQAQRQRKACCGTSAVEDARRVADRLGIPYYVLNFRELFRETVIADFVREYQRGRTPNPCVRCNQHVKFRPVLARAAILGADYIATGHYVRREQDARTGRYVLRRAGDRQKDQSYVLWPVQQDELARTLFPLSDVDKQEVRALARSFGLAVADKPESQEICFVPAGGYRRYLQQVAPETLEPGIMLSTEGEVLGQHPGVAFFTLGQRRGLGFAHSQPMYVVDIQPERNVVVVGDEADIYTRELLAEEVNWVALSTLDSPQRVLARVRYRMAVAPATVYPAEPAGTMRVVFDEPQRAITPGQSVVLYDDDLLLGGGIITATERHQPAADRSTELPAMAPPALVSVT